MFDFLFRNHDAIVIVIISVGLSFILNQYKEIFKLFKKLFRSITKLISFLKRRLKGQYNLNEMEKLFEKPEDKLTKGEKLAVDKAKQVLEEMSDELNKLDFGGNINHAANMINDPYNRIN